MKAILTGDIVGSQRLHSDDRSQLEEALLETAAFVGLDKVFEIFGGDSWQALCEPAQVALTKALVFRAYLLGIKGIETRIGIGIGSIETFKPEKISLSQGEAFVLSGRGIENMTDQRKITIHLSEHIPQTARFLLEANCALLDGITANWTPKQAQAVALTSTNDSQKALAEKFDPAISPQAFGKHLASAQWKLIKGALETTEQGIALLLPSE